MRGIYGAVTFIPGELAMNIRFSRLATGVLVVAAIVMMSSRSWAVFYPLGPSKDEWGLKYEVQLSQSGGDTVTVFFTLADDGRLKPFYSATVVAFSKPDENGSRTYDVKAKIDMKPTQDGKRAGQVQIRKQFLAEAKIRILTLTVNGRPQTAGAAYYDIPLKNYINQAPNEPTVAAPQSPNATR